MSRLAAVASTAAIMFGSPVGLAEGANHERVVPGGVPEGQVYDGYPRGVEGTTQFMKAQINDGRIPVGDKSQAINDFAAGLLEAAAIGDISKIDENPKVEQLSKGEKLILAGGVITFMGLVGAGLEYIRKTS